VNGHVTHELLWWRRFDTVKVAGWHWWMPSHQLQLLEQVGTPLGGWWGAQQPRSVCHDHDDGQPLPEGADRGAVGPPSGKHTLFADHLSN
jgi:hypothetical protein